MTASGRRTADRAQCTCGCCLQEGREHHRQEEQGGRGGRGQHCRGDLWARGQASELPQQLQGEGNVLEREGLQGYNSARRFCKQVSGRVLNFLSRDRLQTARPRLGELNGVSPSTKERVWSLGPVNSTPDL